jgi:hypothetical protein
MSLKYYHRTLGGSIFNTGNITIGLWALGGSFRGLTAPIMWWFNGSTYGVGYQGNATNNKVWIVKQTGLNVTSTAVNNGTSLPEPLNHPTPLIYINEATGYIYVIQNQFHVDSFDVWKSDNPEDITGFTKVTGSFDTDGSYLVMNKYSGTNVTFTTRSDDAPNGFDHNVLEVDLDNPSGYTDTLVCEGDYATNDSWFYPTEVNRYGTSSYYVGGAAVLDYSEQKVYMKGIWITTNFDTYENIAQTYSKNIPATSALTFSEFTSNLNEFGTEAVRTANYGAGGLMQIDNNIYTTIVTGAGEITIYKFTIGTSGSVASLVLPYTINSVDGVYMYYNGSKIVTHFKTTTPNTYIGNIDTDLTTFTFKKELVLPDGEYVGLPWNFDDVTGLYLIGSRSVSGDAGNVPYIITNNKW